MSEKIFDEHDAVKFIRDKVAEAKQYSSDDLLLFIDTMYDYYDTIDDDYDYTETDIVAYVTKQLKKDKENKISLDLVGALVEAELAYEDTLDDIF